jgi:hypothetical protein
MQAIDRGEIVAIIRDRAESDSEFRTRLLTDPSAAMSEILGMSVPDAVRFTVHEESPTDIHLVIPALSNLSDDDLDLVAGGEWSFPNTGPITCGCA